MDLMPQESNNGQNQNVKQIENENCSKIEKEEHNATQKQINIRAQKQIKREKRKKKQAFQSFLKPEGQSEMSVQQSNYSDHEQIQPQIEQQIICRLCEKILNVSKKNDCGFCRHKICVKHLRKRRRNRNTNKFVKICDQCEDNHLFQKYMKLEFKAQQSLTTQQLIIEAKRMQLEEQLKGKRTRLQVLTNRHKQLEEQHNRTVNRYNISQTQRNKKERKLQINKLEVQKQEKQLIILSDSLPRSLEEDYNLLVETNQKITKQLMKYQKLYNEAIKAKSKKQKQLYEYYYRWQQMEKRKKEANNKKNDSECCIY